MVMVALFALAEKSSSALMICKPLTRLSLSKQIAGIQQLSVKEVIARGNGNAKRATSGKQW